MMAAASPTAAPVVATSRFEPSTVPKRNSAVSTPSRRTPTNTTSASAKAEPRASALSTWSSSSCLISRACRRIQKIIQVRSPAAASIAPPSKAFAAPPSSSAPIAKRSAPAARLNTSAAAAPIQTGQKPSRRPLRLRKASTMPTISEASKPSLNITTPAPTRLLGRCKGNLTRVREDYSRNRYGAPLDRRVPGDDLLPRLPDRRVPSHLLRLADALLPCRGDARRLPRLCGRDAEAARDGGSRRARRAQGGDPHLGRPEAGREGRPPPPDHRAAPDRLHGLYGSGGARPRRRARRHLHRRDDRANRGQAGQPGALPA